MREGLITTAIILHELHCTEVKTREDRLLLQKKVFLFQQLGGNLGYSFANYSTVQFSEGLIQDTIEIMQENYTLPDYQLPKYMAEIIGTVNSTVTKQVIKLDIIQEGLIGKNF